VGKPDPIINWYFGATRIDNNQKYELLKDSSNHYLLIIREVDTHDQGEYTCNASNCKGETSWSANLYLNENQNKKASPVSVDEIKPAKALVAPNFLRKIKDSTVSEGHSAK